MRDVAPGDLIHSFRDTRIPAISIAQGTCFEAPKPAEFGSAGQNWSEIGWKIHVRYLRLVNVIRPADEMNRIRPTLPRKYSPRIDSLSVDSLNFSDECHA